METVGKKKKLTRKQRSRRKFIVLIIEGIVLLVVLAGLFIWSKLNKINQTEKFTPEEVNINIDEETQDIMDDYTNIALFGLDNLSTGNYKGGNSDVIMIASINNKTKDVKLVSVYRDSYIDIGDDNYSKATHAHGKGGPKQAIGMLNKNLDLNITQYVAADFNAIAEVVDELGGIELDVTSAEAEEAVIYINQLNEVLGTNAKYISAGTQTLNGVQATAYCRLRYNVGGDDYKRTERQRIVLSKLLEKAKSAKLTTLNSIIDKVLPDINTNFSSGEILEMAANVVKYNLIENQGWPFTLTNMTLDGHAIVVTTDLESNVKLLHEYLFEDADYEPSDVVKSISKEIIKQTGMTAADTTIDTNPFAQADTEEDTTAE